MSESLKQFLVSTLWDFVWSVGILLWVGLISSNWDIIRAQWPQRSGGRGSLSSLDTPVSTHRDHPVTIFSTVSHNFQEYPGFVHFIWGEYGLGWTQVDDPVLAMILMMFVYKAWTGHSCCSNLGRESSWEIDIKRNIINIIIILNVSQFTPPIFQMFWS